jgi:hypothetical protein
MKRIGDIVGVILILLGAWWFLQGTNIVPVGMMAGHAQWTVIGVVLGVIGIGLLVIVHRRHGGSPSATN